MVTTPVPPTPGDDDVPGAVDRRQGRRGQMPDIHRRRCLLADLRTLDGHERRAEPLEAGEILVAGRLVDGALASKFGFDRHDRDAVRLHPAIAAALADIGVDEDAAIGVGKLAALSAPPFLRRAGLDEDDRRHALDVTKPLLNLRQRIPLVPLKSFRKDTAIDFLLRVKDKRDVLHPHCLQLARDLVGREIAVVVLPPGHRDGVVVEDLVGDVHARRDRRADRHQARMVVGAVAEVLEDMPGCRERRLADPVGAFAAHMGIAAGLAVHPERHDVAADPGIGARPVGHLRRSVVRTARAEIRQTRRDLFRVVSFLRILNGLQPGLDRIRSAPLLDQDAADLLGDHHRVQRHARRKQLVAVQRPGPALVPAIDPAPAPVVENRLLDLDLDQLSLFLDDDDQIQPLGPVVEALHVHREGLADLVGRDAKPFRLGRVDAQKAHGVKKVEPVLAGRDKADLRPRLAPDPPVKAIGARKRLCGEALVVDHPRFLRDPVIAQTDVQTALGHVELGHDERHPVRASIDHRCHLHRVLHQLEPGPDTREPAQGKAVETEIENFLHPCRRQHRHVDVHHRPVGLVAGGRGFAGVVVPHRHQDTAVARGAGHVGVAHHVAGPIHPRALAVPEPEDTVEAPFAAQLGLLRAPKCSCSQILVQPGLEPDVGGLEIGFRPRHLLIHRAQRRSAIAGDIPAGVQPRRPVAGFLHQHETHQRLGAVQKNLAGRKIVAVVKRDVAQAHPVLPDLWPYVQI